MKKEMLLLSLLLMGICQQSHAALLNFYIGTAKNNIQLSVKNGTTWKNVKSDLYETLQNSDSISDDVKELYADGVKLVLNGYWLDDNGIVNTQTLQREGSGRIVVLPELSPPSK